MQTLVGGQHLDHYTIIRDLGQGAFSNVYEASDDRDGQHVVLKCPKAPMLGDATTFDRFRREMEIARRLSHPNIQQALDSGEARSAVYLVLEYVEGESFHEFLKRKGKLQPDEAVGYTQQLLAALGYAHQQRVYHRDLKPENVLITPEGQLKIVDFGIAFMEGSRRLTWRWAASTLGTPNYMAPEQIQGYRGDARSDLYATGAVLFEMLAGRPPFAGDDSLAVMDQHLKVRPPRPSRFNAAVPAGLDGIVLRAMRKDPSERYQSAEEFAADLRNYRSLRLEDFHLGPEKALEGPHPNRLLAVFIACLAFGFLGISAAIVILSHLVSR